MHPFIRFKYDFHVDAERVIFRTREMPIISANIFDFTARKFFRREDLSIFIDHMINYLSSTQLVATNSESGLPPLCGSVVDLCFVVRYSVSILVLQSS